MATRGGARPGAGRKPKYIKYHGQVTETETWIADRLPEIAKALYDSATGLYVEEQTDEGEIRRYRRAPDTGAARYLYDRIAGKPVTTIEMDVTSHDDPAREEMNEEAILLAAETIKRNREKEANIEANAG